MQNFTLEQLLQYLYGELNDHQKDEIETELLINWALNEKLQVLKEGRNRLDKLRLFSPRNQTIVSLLNYAENKAPVI